MNEEVEQAIYKAIRAIPRGKVAAYGEVAVRAGLPGRARLVGKLLRDSSPADRLPWHRVLRADGRFAFPEDSPAWIEQKRRLEKERVVLLNGRVPQRYFAWRDDDLDAALWGPP